MYASDAGSQAIASSSGEEEDDVAVSEVMPQLVMPSIAMPARRPFTERGRRMGRLRVMVVGPKGVGKTSLIQSICRVCEDVVHVDPVSSSPTDRITEIGASTKPYPQWRSDLEASQRLRRASISEGVLERNITFVDTPGSDNSVGVQNVRRYAQDNMARMLDMSRLSDTEVVGMLNGDGGPQIDAVLYLHDVDVSTSHEEEKLLQYLSHWTNVIPLVGRSDAFNADQSIAHKRQLLRKLEESGISTNASRDADLNTAASDKTTPTEPFAVSSALGDDPETLDASVLMSSGYLPPLIPSELSYFVHQLLEPDNISRLRHLSATKFILQRHELGSRIDLSKQTILTSPGIPPSSAAVTSTGSLLDEPSKVLVPHASSSYFRSISPTASDSSAVSGRAPTFALENIAEPFRQVRLAKWAQDLRRSLDNERMRYKQMYANPPSDWASSADSEKQAAGEQALTPAGTHRPGKGRLGGDIGVIDPRDPLGLLSFGQAFRRQGWFALQVASGCGLVGAVAWWVIRNWAEVQEWFVPPVQQMQQIHVISVAPSPTRGWLEEGISGARSWEHWARQTFGKGN